MQHRASLPSRVVRDCGTVQNYNVVHIQKNTQTLRKLIGLIDHMHTRTYTRAQTQTSHARQSHPNAFRICVRVVQGRMHRFINDAAHKTAVFVCAFYKAIGLARRASRLVYNMKHDQNALITF